MEVPKLPATALISTREKIATISKKIILYLYFHNRVIFDLPKVLTMFGGETKKILEIIFILEGLGLIFRTSNSKFIFQGFEGMIHKFHCKH